jgi:hypothetical protein
MNNNLVKAGKYEVIFSSFIGKPECLIVYDKFFYWFNVSLSWDENFGIHHLPQIWKPDKKLHVIEIRCLLWCILLNFDSVDTPLTYFSISTTYTHPWHTFQFRQLIRTPGILFNFDSLYTPLTYFSISTTYTQPWQTFQFRQLIQIPDILFNFDNLYTPLTYFSISTTYTHPWICSHDKGVEGGCHIIFNLIAHIHISAVPTVASQMNIITQKAPSEACKIHQSININILSWKTRLACVLFSATLNERF